MMKFIEYDRDVGKRLNSAVDDFNRSVGSFDTRVIPQRRKISQLTTGKEDGFPRPAIVEKLAGESRYAEETGRVCLRTRESPDLPASCAHDQI